ELGFLGVLECVETADQTLAIRILDAAENIDPNRRMRDRLSGVVNDREMRADQTGRRRPILDLDSGQPPGRPNRHVVRHGLALAVGVAILKFGVHLDGRALAREVTPNLSIATPTA